MVLGAAVWAGGEPSPALRRRVEHAIALARAEAARDLLFTGGVGEHPPAEASVMRDLARAAGLEAERLFCEDRATSTWASARLCAPIVRRHAWRRVCVVSDAYHLERARFAFRCFGVEAGGDAPPGSAGSLRTRWRERGARLGYRVRALWTPRRRARRG